LVGVAWFVWYGSRRVEQPRASARLVGLIAVSVNVALFYAWVILYRLGTHDAQNYERDLAAANAYNFLGNYIGLLLVVVGLAGALAGRGPGRILIAVLAVVGVLLWVPLGIL
jgi:hypothetical protein